MPIRSNILTPRLLSLSLVLFLGMWQALQAVELQYTYDVLGRLTRVVDSNNNVTVYVYDALGNITTILRASTDDLPVIDAVAPVAINQGETVDIVLTGNNFLTATLSTDNPGITILNTVPSATELTARLRLVPDAPLGTTTLTITTLLGTETTTLIVLGPLPQIFAVIPAQGSASGGTLVSLSGTNIPADTTLTFNGQAATDVVVNNNTLMARTPPGPLNTLVDVAVSNNNGNRILPNAFRYTFPFTAPGAVAISTGSNSSVTVQLAEPALTETTVRLTSADPTVATVPPTVVLSAGSTAIDVLLNTLQEGTTTVTITIGAATLATAIFVTPPFQGDLELLAATVGSILSGAPLAASVGTVFVPRELATVTVNSGNDRALTLPLATPVPAAGLCVALASSNPAVATVPDEVCLDAGATAVTFTVTGIAAGDIVVTATAGTEVLRLRVLVDRAPGIGSPLFAGVIGSLVVPQEAAALAPIVGSLVVPQEPTTLAPIVGVRVESN